MAYKELTQDQLLLENEELRTRLRETEEALNTVRNGKVDAIVVSGSEGDQVSSLTSAETPYRVLLEEMDEGALTVGSDGTIFYCNNRFASLISQTPDNIIGLNCRDFIVDNEKIKFDRLLQKGLKERANDVISFSRNRFNSNVYLKLSVRKLPLNSGDVCIVASDVTQIIQQQEKLEVLVEKRTKELQNANEKLKEDFQEREQLMHEIESQTAWLEASISSMATGLILYGLDGKAIRMNDTVKKMFPQQPFFDLGIEERAKVMRWETEDGKPFPEKEIPVYRAIHGESTHAMVMAACLNDHKLWVSVSAAPIVTKNNEVLGVVGSFQDITGRKKTEKELSDTKGYLENLINYANAPIIVWNPQSEIQLFNGAFEHLTGYSSFEVIGKKLDILFPYASLTESKDKIRQALTQRWETIEIPILCKNKEVRIVLWNSANIYDSDKKTLISTIAQGNDITERKNSEEALRNSEAKFSNAFRNSPNAITITRLSDGKIIEGNESVYSLLGYRGEDVAGKTTLELGIWTEMADRVRLTQALSTKGFIQNEDFILRKKDGTQVPVNLSASIITINNEQCFLCSFIDLTERKKAETALRVSEERLRVTLTSIGDAVMTFDTDCRVVFLNPVAVKLTGWEPEEAAGQPVENVFRLINELTQVPAEDIIAKVLQEGKVVGLSNHTSLI